MDNFDKLTRANEADVVNIQQRFEQIQGRSRQIYDEATDFVNKERKRIALKEERLAIERECFRKEKAEFEEARNKVLQINQAISNRVLLVVGDKEFHTTDHTIMTVARHPEQDYADKNSIMALMLSKISPTSDLVSKIRIDRDSKFFDIILNYHRERSCEDRSVERWIRDSLCTFSDPELRLIQSEAGYYKIRSLSNYITWLLVEKTEKPNKLQRVTEVFSDASRSKIVGYVTMHDCTVEEGNFTKFVFRSIQFRHKFQFKGCVLKNAVFHRCSFEAHVSFEDCDIRGINFTDCAHFPSAAILTARCIGHIPPTRASD